MERLANNDIKQRIVLEGEKEYSAALKEAQRNLKVLRSELKAETAELGANATAQQKNEVKAKNLQKQIKEQEKVVRTYEKALQEVREKYGDNEEAISKWEVKLNDARTALANMRSGIEETGTSLAKMGAAAQSSAQMGIVATNSLADSLGKVADAGSAISGALESAFSTIAGKIRDTVAQVWESVMDLAARSNNLVDLAGFWNTDVTTIQKWQGAVAEVSGTLEDLNSIVTKINSGDAKKITELTGISGENYQDQWEYAMAVMDAMSKMDKTKRNSVAFDIFGGRQATKAFDLLNDWSTVLEHLDKYDATKGGYGLTEEQLNNMSDLYDKVNGLKQSWQSLKDMATVQLFGSLAMDVTGNLQDIVDAFKEYFQAEDKEGREAALKKVRDNVTELFQSIAKGISAGIAALDEVAKELQESEDPVTQTIGKILGDITKALQWLAEPENWDKIKQGFEGLFALWTGAKAISAIAKIASLAANIKTISSGSGLISRLFGGGGSGTGDTGTGGTGTSSGIGDAATKGAVKTAIGNAVTKVASTTSAALTKYDPTGLTALVGEVLMDKTEGGRALRNGASIGEALGVSWNTIKTGVTKAVSPEGISGAADAAKKYWLEQLPDALWRVLGFKDTNDAVQQVTEVLNKASEYSKIAGEWTFGDDVSAGEAMQIVTGNPTGIPDAALNQKQGSEMRYKQYYFDFTDEMRAAAEKFWDEWRDDEEVTDEQWEAFQKAFEGSEDLWNGINQLIDELMESTTDHSWQNMEDLPADWWGESHSSGMTVDELLGGLPSQIVLSVQKGVSGIKVLLDGYTVGNLVAPYVSEQIAREAQ